MRRHFYRRSIRGRGIAYVMVMLYLMLFSVLAIGFCAASNMSVQIAKNDRAVAESLAAADSGMQFARLQLSQISIQPNVSDADLPGLLAEQLGRQLDGSPNMGGRVVARTGQVVFLPNDSSYIPIDAAAGARFQIQLAVNGRDVWVKTIGRGNNAEISRAIQIRFRFAPRSANDPMGEVHLVPISTSYEEVSP
jgi:hypothetical protein